MRKAALAVALAVAGATLAGITLAGVTLAQGTGEATVTGFVTDTWCGRRGASEKHAEHARTAVASGKAQYAVYDEATRKLYLLDAQTAAPYAGQRVKVTGTLTATLLRHAGQSYAPDAVAAYRDPSAPNGLRASGATSGTSTAPGTIQTATPTAVYPESTAGRRRAISDQGKVQSHEDALDQTTPIAGVLSISSIGAV